MKLTGFSWEVEFDRLRTLMGAELVTIGLDIPLGKINCTDDGTLEYLGRKVVVYIRDQYNRRHSPALLNKFHVANCSTLQEKRDAGEYNKRYVVATRTDGKFIVNFRGGEKEVECKLYVCKNCLTELNYKNYVCEKSAGDKIVKSFDLEEFFKMYGSQIIWRPPHTDKTARLNDYTPNWRQVSLRYREQKKWKCEECNADFGDKKKRRFLHVHHINKLKHNNEDENLQVLCIKCHAEKDGHNSLKNTPAYAEYQKLISRNSTNPR